MDASASKYFNWTCSQLRAVLHGIRRGWWRQRRQSGGDNDDSCSRSRGCNNGEQGCDNEKDIIAKNDDVRNLNLRPTSSEIHTKGEKRWTEEYDDVYDVTAIGDYECGPEWRNDNWFFVFFVWCAVPVQHMRIFTHYDRRLPNGQLFLNTNWQAQRKTRIRLDT